MIISNSAGSKIIYPDERIAPIGARLRIKSTVKTFARASGFTAVSVFIPILHFVLVPVGLVLTATMTYRTFRRNYFVENLEINCPSCKVTAKQSVSGQELPLKTVCMNCGHMVYLENEHSTNESHLVKENSYE
ncbi:MAG: hypothetical protein IT287_02275 [Bdellovibrionaceae bacterium]|nr:hypothetical protein [Pseudobdellovibrionaceae bacterium]